MRTFMHLEQRQDLLSRTGAEDLAQRIQTYWHKRGFFSAETWVDRLVLPEKAATEESLLCPTPQRARHAAEHLPIDSVLPIGRVFYAFDPNPFLTHPDHRHQIGKAPT